MLVTLPKKSDLLNCNNYRTISLISHASKLLLKIIGRRMEQKLEEEISDTEPKAIVFPMATYGCEFWVFTGRVEKRITAYENKCARKILRIPYTKHVTNGEVREVCLIEKEEILRMVKKRKLKFFGHMARHNSLQKTVMAGRVSGRRGRGRPRRRWEDDVKGMLDSSMQGAGTLAQDRRTFRRTVM